MPCRDDLHSILVLGSGPIVIGRACEFDNSGTQACRAHRVLLEQSVTGWKEFELEVMRDRADNALVICSVENFDAMGVHTGDSITVEPRQALSDREYQAMRNDASRVIRRVGVATGGSNI